MYVKSVSDAPNFIPDNSTPPRQRSSSLSDGEPYMSMLTTSEKLQMHKREPGSLRKDGNLIPVFSPLRELVEVAYSLHQSWLLYGPFHSNTPRQRRHSFIYFPPSTPPLETVDNVQLPLPLPRALRKSSSFHIDRKPLSSTEAFDVLSEFIDEAHTRSLPEATQARLQSKRSPLYVDGTRFDFVDSSSTPLYPMPDEIWLKIFALLDSELDLLYEGDGSREEDIRKLESTCIGLMRVDRQFRRVALEKFIGLPIALLRTPEACQEWFNRICDRKPHSTRVSRLELAACSAALDVLGKVRKTAYLSIWASKDIFNAWRLLEDPDVQFAHQGVKRLVLDVDGFTDFFPSPTPPQLTALTDLSLDYDKSTALLRPLDSFWGWLLKSYFTPKLECLRLRHCGYKFTLSTAVLPPLVNLASRLSALALENITSAFNHFTAHDFLFFKALSGLRILTLREDNDSRILPVSRREWCYWLLINWLEIFEHIPSSLAHLVIVDHTRITPLWVRFIPGAIQHLPSLAQIMELRLSHLAPELIAEWSGGEDLRELFLENRTLKVFEDRKDPSSYILKESREWARVLSHNVGIYQRSKRR